MAQKLTTGKNKLWVAFQAADPLVKAEILLELKKRGLYRHWYSAACKATYNLLRPQAPLRDLFLEFMPETAELFGLPPVKKPLVKAPKVPSPAPLFEQQS